MKTQIKIQELSLQMQKIILIKAKFYLIKEKRKELISNYGKRGLCFYIVKALKNLGIENNNEFILMDYIDLLIPTFNRENAVKNARANPNSFFAYWWDKGDYDNRLFFLDYLINKLK